MNGILIGVKLWSVFQIRSAEIKNSFTKKRSFFPFEFVELTEPGWNRSWFLATLRVPFEIGEAAFQFSTPSASLYIINGF